MDGKKDVGIKIAKPFYDVNNAGDTDVIFNSSWPTLQIISEKTVEITNNGTNFSARAEHNLGFPPFVCMWGIYADGSIMRLVDIEKIGGALSTTTITNTIATVSGLSSATGFNMTHVHFKFYNIDLSKDVEYPFIQQPTQQILTDRDFGIKLAKEGKDINSEDVRDYILHSRCQSPLVLAVKTQESGTASTTGGSIEYKSPYKFPSWVFGYVRSGNTYKTAPYFSQGYPSITIYPNEYRYMIEWENSAGDDGATILVLRDPFFAGTGVEVTY